MGRPTDLTPDLQTRITNVLTAGVPIHDACAYVGINESTYFKWMKRGAAGRKGDEIYIEFFQSATRARVQARVTAVTKIKESIWNGNTEDARWFLERSDPTNWGRKDMLISLGLDPSLLRTLKQQADAAGVDLAQVFEEMVNQLAGTYTTADSAE